jgi:hypothetical protein
MCAKFNYIDMAYIKLHPIKQFDFQINRILTYGVEACNLNEIKNGADKIKDFDTWYIFWKKFGSNSRK